VPRRGAMASTDGTAPRKAKRSFKHSRMAASGQQPAAERATRQPEVVARDVVAPVVLGEVTERAYVPPRAPGGVAGVGWSATTSLSGFPTAMHRRDGGLGLGRRSVQARQAQTDCGVSELRPSRSLAAAALPRPPPQQEAAAGAEPPWEEIHEENMARLSSMSAEEIAEAQRALQSSLPPGLVRKLQQRGLERACGGEPGAHADGSAASTVAVVPTAAQQPATTTAPGAVDEEAKLQWTTPVGAQDDDLASSQNTHGPDWRFGFDGLVIDMHTSTEVQSTELYHHGEQPARPGYTLAEVVMLIRSTVPNQRVLGLQLLEALVQRASSDLRAGTERFPSAVAVLDAVMDPGLRIPLLLRCALDDSHVSVIRAAVRAVQALLVDEQDSASRLVLAHEFEGWRRCDAQPRDSDRYSISASEECSTIGEQEQRCFSDLVAGLVKMGCLPRLRYLLEVLELPQSSMLDIVRTLRRISDHSAGIADEVARCPRLLPWLVGSCVRRCSELNGSSCAWLTEVFHLLRQLCDTSSAIAMRVWKMPDLVVALSRVLTDTAGEQPRVSTVCGAMRLWRSFLHGAAEAPDSVLPVASSFLDLYPALSSCYIKPSCTSGSTAEIASAMLDNFELLCRPEFLESGDIHWAHVSGLFKDALWWLKELKPVMQESVAPFSSAALVGSLLHFAASYTREIHRPTSSGTAGAGHVAVAESSPLALLDEYVLPCLQSPLLTSLLQAAPSVLWTTVVPDVSNSCALHRCCPRLNYQPSKMSAGLNAVVGALRWLYQCTLLQGPAWIPSQDYTGVVCQLHATVPCRKPEQYTGSTVLLRCDRIPTLLRIFSCRVLLVHASRAALPSVKSIGLIAAAMAMVHSIGPGDETLCIEYIHDSLLADATLQMLQVAAGECGCGIVKEWQGDELGSLRREIVRAVVRIISGTVVHTEVEGVAVNVELNAGPSTSLPLTKPVYMLPFQPNHSSDADSVVDDISLPAARAGLQLILLISAAQCSYGTVGDAPSDALSLADAWIFVSRALVSSDAIWQDDTVVAVTNSICDQLVRIERAGSATLRLQDATRPRFGMGEHHYGSTTSDLLQKLLTTYGEDSFGEATLGRCVALFLREDQPMELRRQIWRYCAANGGGLLELLDPSCWSKGLTAASAVASSVDTRPISGTEQYEMARAQQQALLTPMANNIARSGRSETPLFCLAIDGVTNFLRGTDLGERDPEGKPENDDDDDRMDWERKQLLSDLFTEAEIAGQPTALHSIVSRLQLDGTAQAQCLRDLDTLERVLGL
jgi:hypothetical protein